MAVNQLTGLVKVSFVTRGFGNNVKQNGSQVGETPVTEELPPEARLCSFVSPHGRDPVISPTVTVKSWRRDRARFSGQRLFRRLRRQLIHKAAESTTAHHI